MTSREDSVLAARDPSLNDENDWEEFSLSEVRVLIPGKLRYANLLSASPDNPVQVTGCLDEVEEEQASLVLDEDYRTKRIVIENVTHYAYGQHNDGEVGIWVAGRAGWFSISPAKGFRSMFSTMTDAIDLLYFLADRHQRKRRKRKDWNPTVEYLCEEYVIHTHGICEDADDSAEVFYGHRQFLLTRMLKGEEGVQWTKTNLFEHLCEKFPGDYEQIKAQLEPKAEEESDAEENEEKEDDEKSEKPTHSPDPTLVSKNHAETVYQVILDLKEAGHLAKRQLDLDLVISTLVSRYNIETTEYAHDLISARAGIVIEMMDEAKTSNFDWSRKKIYRELEEASKKNELQDIALTPLRPRSPEKDESSPEDSEHEEQPRPRRRRVRKSVLRPKSSISTKQIGKRTRSAMVDQEYLSDDNQDAMDEFETPSKVRGHELVRDPLSTRAKRRTRSILSDSGSTPFAKTPLREAMHSRNTSMSIADQEPSDVDPAHAQDNETDSWTCQIPGCGEVIYNKNSKEGKKTIDDHNQIHEDFRQEKIDLVHAEQRLNIGLPVDNLLDRIREFGAFDTGLLNIANGAANGVET